MPIWDKKFNFRGSAGFVVDGPDEIYVLPTDTYPTTRGGITFGWLDSPTLIGRDEDATADRRVAGCITDDPTMFPKQQCRFQVDAAIPASGYYYGRIIHGTRFEVTKANAEGGVNLFYSIPGIGILPAGLRPGYNGDIYIDWPTLEARTWPGDVVSAPNGIIIAYFDFSSSLGLFNPPSNPFTVQILGIAHMRLQEIPSGGSGGSAFIGSGMFTPGGF